MKPMITIVIQTVVVLLDPTLKVTAVERWLPHVLACDPFKMRFVTPRNRLQVSVSCRIKGVILLLRLIDLITAQGCVANLNCCLALTKTPDTKSLVPNI